MSLSDNRGTFTEEEITHREWADEAERWGIDPSAFSSTASLRLAVLGVARGSLLRPSNQGHSVNASLAR